MPGPGNMELSKNAQAKRYRGSFMAYRAVQPSFSLSACPSEAGTLFSLYSENLKCSWNLDEENNFITICAATDRMALVLRVASHGWCDTNKSITEICFKINQAPTAQRVCDHQSDLFNS